MQSMILSCLFILLVTAATFATEPNNRQSNESNYKAKRSYQFDDEEVLGEFGTNMIDVIDTENKSTESLEIEISFLDKIQTNEDKDAILYRNK